MEDLVAELFGPTSLYEPRFFLSRQDDAAATTKSPPPTKDLLLEYWCRMEQDPILSYLAPQDILSWWQCCTTTWNSCTPSERYRIMLHSVFSYLRISQEAAHHVQVSYEGGWTAFLTTLVQVCDYMVDKVYGQFEVDVAHRTFVAEQCCFWTANNNDNNDGQLKRQLAMYEWKKYYGPMEDGATNHHDENNQNTTESTPISVPTLEQLMNVPSRHVSLGGQPEVFGAHDKEVNEWSKQNRQWMQTNTHNNHHPQSLNSHYQRRLQRGLYPMIWMNYIDNGPIERAIGIGPHREQFLYSISSYHAPLQEATESFLLCCDMDDDNDDEKDVAVARNNGIVSFLLGYPCHPQALLDPVYTLGIAIWCMRHGIEPLTYYDSMQWNTLIEQEARDEADQEFYKKALTSPLFGPANPQDYYYYDLTPPPRSFKNGHFSHSNIE